jgi:cytochrome c553
VHCHKTNNANLERVAAVWPKKFFADAGNFMTSPAGHASCVDCHWKAAATNEKTAYAVYEPYINSCAECHRNALLKPRPNTTTNDASKITAAGKNQTTEAKIVPVSSSHNNADVPVLPAAFAATAWLGLRASRRSFSTRFRRLTRSRKTTAPLDRLHGLPQKASQIDSLETFRLKENGVQLAACVDCHGDKGGKTKVAAIARIKGTRARPEVQLRCATAQTSERKSTALTITTKRSSAQSRNRRRRTADERR